MLKIGFIGAGKMAEALIKAVINSRITDNKNIYASDKNKERLDCIKKETKIHIFNDNKKIIDNSDIVFLAVKPQNMDEVLDEIKNIVTNQLIVSIAAGITLKKLELKLKNKRIVRVMPNTPCLVGEMAAGFSLGKNCNDKDAKIIEEILSSAGKAFLLKEELLDAVTGLSGSGPAFIAYLLEGMIEGGVKSGLNKDIATELALQTAKGTAKLLQETGMTAQELIKTVSSPGGTTIAGREILEKSDVKEILIKTIEKATKRSKELGK